MKLFSLFLVPFLAPLSLAYTNGITDLLRQSFKPKENLQDYSQAFYGTLLDINLRVDDALGISNLQLQLSKDKKDSNLLMPGYHGPHPDASGGVSSLDILQPGHFVDMTGMHSLKLGKHASWELTWTKQARAGTLICGLELLEPAVRNSHSQQHDKKQQQGLEAGRLYLAFPVWTSQLLQEAQADKEACKQAVAALEREKHDEIRKMQESDNLLAKALHYRNAAAAVEKYSMQPIKSMSLVPSDDDVMPIAEDLYLTLAGTLWTKQGDGHAFLGSRKQRLLGTAFIAKPSIESLSLHP